MKIAILLESFQPEYWGGRETRWKNLIEIFAKSNEITIYGDFSKISPEIAFPGVHAKFINIGPFPRMYTKKGSRSLKHAALYTFKTYKILFSKSEVVLTDQTPLITIPFLRLFAFISGAQLSITWHEVWRIRTWFRYSRVMGIFGIFLQELALSFSKNIVVPSTDVATSLNKRFFSKNSVVISNGVSASMQQVKVCEKSLKNAPIELLYVGRLIKHKNCDFLVSIMNKAISQGRNWRLTIVGMGPMEAKLRELVCDMGLQEKVFFKSNLPQNVLMEQYSSSDIFVFPSEREGYGISVAEAISQQLPVIVYDYPENASTALVQTRSSGLKLGKLEVDLWIMAIEELTQNRELIQFQVQSELVTWESIANEYLNYLKSLRKPN